MRTRKRDRDCVDDPYDWTWWYIKTAMLWESNTCIYCHIKLDIRSATVDHLIPVIRGGTDDATNLVLACRECNTLKGELLPLHFLWGICPVNWVDPRATGSRRRGSPGDRDHGDRAMVAEDIKPVIGMRIVATRNLLDQNKKIYAPAGTFGTVTSLYQDGTLDKWEDAGVVWDNLKEHICAVLRSEVMDVKPTWVGMYGAIITVHDKADDKAIKSYNFPTSDPSRNKNPNAFTDRVVRELAALGYEVRTCPSVAGGTRTSIVIGG